MGLRAIRKVLVRLARHRRGAALVEFAIAAPVMLSLYLMAYTLSDAISANRKVTVATRALTDVTSRFNTASGSDVTNVLGAADKVLAPYSSGSNRATLRISEVQVTSATQAKVIWSCETGPGSALAANAVVTLPSGMVTTSMIPNASAAPPITGAFIVMGEVTYNYTPTFSYNGMGSMTFADRIFLVPRVSTNIPLTGSC